MNVVPAQVAGVGSIALASPPQQGRTAGCPHPTILAACALLGVEEVYAVGGAQAIAMFAYGAGPCRPVDLVTGPGNIYVVAAKRLLAGVVGIDSEAGPTEIAILADDTADAAYVAADLVSQAEHDPLAASVLVTDSERSPTTSSPSSTSRSPRPGTPSGSAPRSAGRSRASCWSTTSSRASTSSTPTPPSTSRSTPATRRPSPPGCATPARSSSARTPRSASATTAPAPTTCCRPRGCACHSSGLSVRAFLRSVHVVDYTREALAEVAGHVVTLAEAEDLPGHGAAVRVRFED